MDAVVLLSGNGGSCLRPWKLRNQTDGQGGEPGSHSPGDPGLEQGSHRRNPGVAPCLLPRRLQWPGSQGSEFQAGEQRGH